MRKLRFKDLERHGPAAPLPQGPGRGVGPERLLLLDPAFKFFFLTQIRNTLLSLKIT